MTADQAFFLVAFIAWLGLAAIALDDAEGAQS